MATALSTIKILSGTRYFDTTYLYTSPLHPIFQREVNNFKMRIKNGMIHMISSLYAYA